MQPSQSPHEMATSLNSDDLLNLVLSSSRDSFWQQHSHIPELERQQLWSQRLENFKCTPSSSHGETGFDGKDNNTISEPSGKRCLQAISSQPSSGLPAKKRRATSQEPISEHLDLNRPSPYHSHSSPAQIPLSSVVSRTGNSTPDDMRIMSEHRPSQIVSGHLMSSNSQHSTTGDSPSFGSENLLPQQVREFSRQEFDQRYLDGTKASPFPKMSTTDSPTSTNNQDVKHRNSKHRMGVSNYQDHMLSYPLDGGVGMSRSLTTDSLCGGMSMIGFTSNRSVSNNLEFPPDQSSAHFFPQSYVQNNDVDYSLTSSHLHRYPDTSNMENVRFSQSLPETGSNCFPSSLYDSSSCFPSSLNSSMSASSTEMKHSLSSESQESYRSSQSRAQRRALEQIVQGTRKIAPKAAERESLQSNGMGHKKIKIPSEDGTSREVAVIPKASVHRPARQKTYCSFCNEQPDGFHGEHELRRHVERSHSVVRKVWVCVDISADKKFLSNCKACRNQKRYGANYNAAAHLRRTHFNPCQRGRGGRGKDSEKRGGKGGGTQPSMDVLKHWMEQREEVIDNAPPLVENNETAPDATKPSMKRRVSDASDSSESSNDSLAAAERKSSITIPNDLTFQTTDEPQLEFDLSPSMTFEFDDFAGPPLSFWDEGRQSSGISGGYTATSTVNMMNAYDPSYFDSSLAGGHSANAGLDTYIPVMQ